MAIRRVLVEKTLRKFPFVMWDRFVPFPEGVEVYGWIDRPQDAYKDYITLTIYDHGGIDLTIYDHGGIDFNTSSAKYSLQIYKIITGGTGRGHRKCKRVEHFFRVRNCIKLKTHAHRRSEAREDKEKRAVVAAA